VCTARSRPQSDRCTDQPGADNADPLACAHDGDLRTRSGRSPCAAWR
jgi:hypothetical protein